MKAQYQARRVGEWLDRLASDKIALPEFQRSYVWKRSRVAKYLTALLSGRPTGVFLVLEKADPAQFAARTLKNLDSDVARARELVIDGQQRLTSLWNALHPTSNGVRYFIEVKNLAALEMEPVTVHPLSFGSPDWRRLDDAQTAYAENRIPVDILLPRLKQPSGLGESDNSYDPGQVWTWCNNALPDDADGARRLEIAIKEALVTRLKHDVNLHYCTLPASTDADEAIDIFVQTNQSSATIKMFDIVVATAKKDHDANLRDVIARFHRKSDLTRHFFRGDDEKTIPEIGEWLLKVACLRFRHDGAQVGIAPKTSNYRRAFRFMMDEHSAEETSQADSPADRLLHHMERSLQRLSELGSCTDRTWVSWPAAHVLSALQPRLGTITKSMHKDEARRLVEAFAWRAFITSRYEVRANDALLEDYRGLVECLAAIEAGHPLPSLPPIFDENRFPVPTKENLTSDLGWINTKSRMARAIVAATLHAGAVDWVTGEKLTVARVRDLEAAGKLDRHHVFASSYLKDVVERRKINHALNGVVLDKATNLTLAGISPRAYLEKVVDKSTSLTESELRRRVKSHFVPYDALWEAKGPATARAYEKFLRCRAALIAREFRKLAAHPVPGHTGRS